MKNCPDCNHEPKQHKGVYELEAEIAALERKPERVRGLAEKWELIVVAFTSPAYTVSKPMDAVQVLKDASRDLQSALEDQ